ncbi:hypothetical protein J6590_073853, partial [Homalodisca vitripennis]
KSSINFENLEFDNNSTESDYFKVLFDNHLVRHIVYETNYYCQQIQGPSSPVNHYPVFSHHRTRYRKGQAKESVQVDQ